MSPTGRPLPFPDAPRICPDCELSFTGSKCPTCDWQTEPKAEGKGRPGWKTSCEWMTSGRRCLIRPSAIIEGGRHYCAWHHTIALMGSGKLAAHFDTYEAWADGFSTKGLCVMEAHYPARVTFSWVCGEPVSGTASPCASSTCSLRLTLEAQKPASPITPGQYRREVSPLVQMVLAGPVEPEGPDDW